jgi:hypothetical protein
MNKLIRLTAATTASAALAGLALIGTAGAASAETRTAVQQERNASITVTDRDDERHQDRGDDPRRDRDHDGRWDHDGRHDRDGRRDGHGHGQWRQGKDGHWYWHGDDRRTYYRYDGHRFARWIDGKWVIVLLDRGHDADRWYFDQVLDARQNDGRRV